VPRRLISSRSRNKRNQPPSCVCPSGGRPLACGCRQALYDLFSLGLRSILLLKGSGCDTCAQTRRAAAQLNHASSPFNGVESMDGVVVRKPRQAPKPGLPQEVAVSNRRKADKPDLRLTLPSLSDSGKPTRPETGELERRWEPVSEARTDRQKFLSAIPRGDLPLPQPAHAWSRHGNARGGLE